MAIILATIVCISFVDVLIIGSLYLIVAVSSLPLLFIF